MSPTLLARVDGLPVSLLEREQVWPVASGVAAKSRVVLPARKRARIERQTAGVHECRTPAWAKVLVAQQLAEEDAAIRQDLAEAGIL